MSSKVEKTQIDISRRLKDTAFSLKVYSIWATLAFLTFGLLGIYPQVALFHKEISTQKEMKEINKSLVSKINVITQEAAKMESHVKSIEALGKSLPEDYETQNYIVDVSFAVAKVGYSLTQLSAVRATYSDQKIEVSTKLVGNGKVSELVKSIESLDRAAKINELGFTEANGKRTINCSLDLYVLK